MLMAVDRRHEADRDEFGIDPLPRLLLVAAYTTDLVGDLLDRVSRAQCMARVKSVVGSEGVDGLIAAITALGTVPDAVVIEMHRGETADRLMVDLERLAPFCGEATQVFVIGHHNDIALYRRLKQEGAADYLVAPLQPVEVIRTISEHVRARREREGAKGKLTVVVGARGGIGATTIAANLGWLGSHSGSSLLVDLSMPMCSIPGVLAVRPDQDLAQVLYQPGQIDAELLERLTLRTPQAPNLGIICADADFSQRRDLTTLAALAQTARAAARMVVLDMPAWLIGPDTNAILAGADHVVLVTSPDFAGMPRARALIGAMRSAGAPDPILVLNSAGVPGRKDWTATEVGKALAIEPDAIITIPFDPQLFGAAEAHGSFVAAGSAAASGVVTAIREVRARVTPGPEQGASVAAGVRPSTSLVTAIVERVKRIASRIRRTSQNAG